MKKLHLILVFVFAVLAVNSQNVTIYNVANSGLSADRIASITEIDNDIWIGEGKGISRFDGNTWEHFVASGMGAPWEWIWIYNILPDDNGNIWACGEAGLFKYNGALWTYYGEGTPELAEEGYMFLDMLIDDDGIIWLLGGNTVWAYIYSFNPDTETWTLYNKDTYPLLDNSLRSFKMNSEGKIIIAAKDVGFLEFDGETFVERPAVTTFEFDIDEAGNYYSGGYAPKHGLYLFDADFEQTASYNLENSQIPFDWLTFVSYNEQADYKAIWFAGVQTSFQHQGVGVYDQQKNFFLKFDNTTGLSENDIQAFFFRDNEAWMGTYDSGVMKMDFTNTPFITVDTGVFVVDIQMGEGQEVAFNIINQGGAGMSYVVNMEDAANWINPVGTTGTVAAYESNPHDFVFDATNSTPGTYETTFKIVSNGGIAYLKAVMNVEDISGSEELDQSVCSIYPNPASDYFTVNSQEAITSIKIISKDGQCVYESNHVDHMSRINTKQLAVGSYIVQLVYKGELINKKLLIYR